MFFYPILISRQQAHLPSTHPHQYVYLNCRFSIASVDSHRIHSSSFLWQVFLQVPAALFIQDTLFLSACLMAPGGEEQPIAPRLLRSRAELKVKYPRWDSSRYFQASQDCIEKHWPLHAGKIALFVYFTCRFTDFIKTWGSLSPQENNKNVRHLTRRKYTSTSVRVRELCTDQFRPVWISAWSGGLYSRVSQCQF